MGYKGTQVTVSFRLDSRVDLGRGDHEAIQRAAVNAAKRKLEQLEKDHAEQILGIDTVKVEESP